MSAAERLAALLEPVRDGHLLVVTGAGISLASGIPTFRGDDAGAIWKRDVTELGTRSFFEEDPAGSWSWYLSRFSQVTDCRPNPGHEALVGLEELWETGPGELLLITQNVDTLHEQAGSRALVKVHGSADRVRCSREGCELGPPRGSIPRDQVDMTAFLADPRREHLPVCPSCGALLRQHVLWFDEYYQSHEDYGWDRVTTAAQRFDLLLFVGTSLSVGVTELFLQAGLSRGKPMVSLDPGAPTVELASLTHLRAAAEQVLPAALRLLRE
jgi:NAD-dependent protein deacetylase/lipoamidase